MLEYFSSCTGDLASDMNNPQGRTPELVAPRSTSQFFVASSSSSSSSELGTKTSLTAPTSPVVVKEELWPMLPADLPSDALRERCDRMMEQLSAVSIEYEGVRERNALLELQKSASVEAQRALRVEARALRHERDDAIAELETREEAAERIDRELEEHVDDLRLARERLRAATAQISEDAGLRDALHVTRSALKEERAARQSAAGEVEQLNRRLSEARERERSLQTYADTALARLEDELGASQQERTRLASALQTAAQSGSSGPVSSTSALTLRARASDRASRRRASARGLMLQDISGGGGGEVERLHDELLEAEEHGERLQAMADAANDALLEQIAAHERISAELEEAHHARAAQTEALRLARRDAARSRAACERLREELAAAEATAASKGEMEEGEEAMASRAARAVDAAVAAAVAAAAGAAVDAAADATDAEHTLQLQRHVELQQQQLQLRSQLKRSRTNEADLAARIKVIRQEAGSVLEATRVTLKREGAEGKRVYKARLRASIQLNRELRESMALAAARKDAVRKFLDPLILIADGSGSSTREREEERVEDGDVRGDGHGDGGAVPAALPDADLVDVAEQIAEEFNLLRTEVKRLHCRIAVAAADAAVAADDAAGAHAAAVAVAVATLAAAVPAVVSSAEAPLVAKTKTKMKTKKKTKTKTKKKKRVARARAKTAVKSRPRRKKAAKVALVVPAEATCERDDAAEESKSTSALWEFNVSTSGVGSSNVDDDSLLHVPTTPPAVATRVAATPPAARAKRLTKRLRSRTATKQRPSPRSSTSIRSATPLRRPTPLKREVAARDPNHANDSLDAAAAAKSDRKPLTRKQISMLLRLPLDQAVLMRRKIYAENRLKEEEEAGSSGKAATSRSRTRTRMPSRRKKRAGEATDVMESNAETKAASRRATSRSRKRTPVRRRLMAAAAAAAEDY